MYESKKPKFNFIPINKYLLTFEKIKVQSFQLIYLKMEAKECNYKYSILFWSNIILIYI